MLRAASDPAGSAETAAATRAAMRSSGLIGRIEIPRLKIEAVVAEGTSDLTLERAVGHLRSSPLPGESGRVALAGHRDTFFRRLKNVMKGDRIRITTPDGVFRYRVESVEVVTPDRSDVLASDGPPSLVLVTCYPFGFIGNAPKRFIVTARQVSPAVDDEAVSVRSPSRPLRPTS
jgi:LPXTG-site transpeptidase (sortase) family protein